jgi:spore germination protein GerM
VQALLTLADSEQATTSIPRGTRLVAVRRDGENVELELNSVFVATPTREVPLALAQLVFTLTEVPGVQRARIEVDGSAVPLVDANGQVLGRPLQRSDFAALSGRSAD